MRGFTYSNGTVVVMVDTSILPVCDLFVAYSDWLILTYDDDYKRFYCQNDRVFADSGGSVFASVLY